MDGEATLRNMIDFKGILNASRRLHFQQHQSKLQRNQVTVPSESTGALYEALHGAKLDEYGAVGGLSS